MKKNILLSFSTLILKLLCLITIIGFIVNTIVLIHWHFNPEFYAKFNFLEPNQASESSLGISYKSSYSTDADANEHPFALNKIKLYSLYFMYLQLSAIFAIIFLLSVESIRVINSVRLVQSFRKSNIFSFRKIGKYLFALFFLSGFRIIIADMAEYYAFLMNLTPLFLMLIAFVLGEIFKEGNDLLEENKLTI